MSWAIAYLREAGTAGHSLPAFPERGGLLGWGADGLGNEYYWLTDGEPDKWPVVVVPDDEPPHIYELGIASFLSALIERRLTPWYLASDDPWPDGGAQLLPVAP